MNYRKGDKIFIKSLDKIGYYISEVTIHNPNNPTESMTFITVEVNDEFVNPLDSDDVIPYVVYKRDKTIDDILKDHDRS